MQIISIKKDGFKQVAAGVMNFKKSRFQCDKKVSKNSRPNIIIMSYFLQLRYETFCNPHFFVKIIDPTTKVCWSISRCVSVHTFNIY